MEIKIQHIKVENFKGIKNFTLKMNGKSVEIRGKNGTGKTSITDAFYWLLSDQDSIGQSKFNAIELDQDGRPVDNQDAIVQADLVVDGEPIKLKKIYQQKWTKKRGQAQAEFTGHTTEYFWNKIPMTKRDFEDRLKEIIDPKLIRVLSDVHYFCGTMRPDDRRKILLEIAKMKKIPPPKFLGIVSPEEYREMLMRDRKEINKHLDDIPKIIAELNSILAESEDIDVPALEKIRNEMNDEIESKIREIVSIKEGNRIGELKAELSGIRSEKIETIKHGLLKAKEDIYVLSQKIDANQRMIEDYSRKESELTEKWKAENAKKFVIADTCFACGQSIPDSQISDQRQKFDAAKRHKLDGIVAQAKDVIEKIKGCKQMAGVYAGQVAGLKSQCEDYEINLVVAKAELAGQQDGINAEIAAAMGDIRPQVERLEKEISEISLKKGDIENQLLSAKNDKRLRDRADRKNAELLELNKKHEDIERELFELDEYMKQKLIGIESGINEKFKITKWKLFEIQVNKGVKDICEAMFNGVPYSTDLNTGAKINVGLDVINTLSAHYDCTLPVFVDNAESVTDWNVDYSLQTIMLIADPAKKKLEVK